MIDALFIGVALAVVALGLTMIFVLLDVINLAHGDLYMLGGYAAFTLLGWGAGYWGALVLVPILIGLIGWGLEELGIRPLLARADRATVTLLLTFGVSLMLRDLAQVVWGTDTHAVTAPFTGMASMAQVFVPTYRLFIFGAGVLAIGATWWLVYRTRIGAGLRATAVGPGMVASFGIPIRLVYGLTFMYGCALAVPTIGNCAGSALSCWPSRCCFHGSPVHFICGLPLKRCCSARSRSVSIFCWAMPACCRSGRQPISAWRLTCPA